MAEFAFDPATVEESPRDFSALPAGKYLALITESEIKKTKAGDGEYLALTFQVIDGEFKNRLVWHNLNMVNKNETAVNIARSELKAICDSIAVGAFKDTWELHGKPMVITLKVGEFNGNPNNSISKFEAAKVVAASESADIKPPWMK